MILVTGFGAFGEIRENPSARLVQAIHGQYVAGERLVSLVLPVSYERGPRRALTAAQTLRPLAIIGFGVARGRTRPLVERQAINRVEGADIDGKAPTSLGRGHHHVPSSLDAFELAEAMEIGLSEDAGHYVCNAWLYRMVTEAPCPAAFIHVPAEGMEPSAVLRGLTRWMQRRADRR